MSTQPNHNLAVRGPEAGDALRALIEPHKAAVVAKLVELAKAGDPRSIDSLLKYLAPPAKPDAERIEVPGLRDAPTILEKSLCIIDAVSRGLVSVEAGEKVQRMLELHTKAVTLSDLAAEVDALKRGRATPVVERVEPPRLPSSSRIPHTPADAKAPDDFTDLA